MKNKTKTYLLLALVLAIWGIIGYKIISATNPTSPITERLQTDATFTPKIKKEIDTFSIKTVNRDPFLGTLLVKKRTKTERPKLQASIVWKPITYHGTISNKSGNAKVFIVSIDNQQHLMKPGQTINEVKLIKGNNNSVLFSYKGSRKTITKS